MAKKFIKGDIVIRTSRDFDDAFHFYGHIFEVGRVVSVVGVEMIYETGDRSEVSHFESSLRHATPDEIETYLVNGGFEEIEIL